MTTKGEKILAAAAIAIGPIVIAPPISYLGYEMYEDSAVSNALDHLFTDERCNKVTNRFSSAQMLIGLRSLEPELTKEQSRAKLAAFRFLEWKYLCR